MSSMIELWKWKVKAETHAWVFGSSAFWGKMKFET
jgi:hypothetical protein